MHGLMRGRRKKFLRPTLLFIGWVWGVDKAIDEVTNHGKLSFPLKGFWSVMIKYVAPVGILFVFAQATGLLELIMGA